MKYHKMLAAFLAMVLAVTMLAGCGKTLDEHKIDEPETNESEVSKPETATVSEPPVYRLIGECFGVYILVEAEDKLCLIDKHAAHERIIFETLKAGLREASVTSQLLMIPLEVMLTSEEIQTLTQYREEIEAIGFSFSSGRYTVTVSAIPEGIETEAVPDMLAVMAERIQNNTGSAKLTRDIIFEKALKKLEE